ncbi:sigma-70 family RNA polymerase sigma factor [Corticimicrobacter populi]|uniref:RNA polymerase subunit sigma n=1 Tax=Corticimicrobacter populi TaxID=2175229 RepID=A0A2V1K7H6_9BURK|nr:sigma-70 family RNA polymerase sigma factor [Corticimicrobacter populi]PWF25425.1 RNA polymerase subunit sigma [Corticimicrobacter populi]
MLYVDHHGWLQGWLRRRLDNAGDVSDLAQDVFMRLLMRQAPIQVREPRALLATIARGLVIDHWRRRDLEQAWLETLASLPESEVPSAETRMILMEALTEIDRMLDTLKPVVRNAFLLAQLEGLTCRQIGERLGVSVATVERHIAKGLRACYAARFET